MAAPFSGSAADMLKAFGQAVPEQAPPSSHEAAQAAKAKLDAEKKCEDEHCNEDHAHTHVHTEACAHGHDHGHAAHANEHSHGHDGHGEAEHEVAAKLRAALEATYVDVVDESDGCGAKLKIIIVSSMFEGKPLLAQHRLVNDAAKAELAKVHAFNIKTYTPAKWEKFIQL